MYLLYYKPIFDFILSLILLLFLFPFLLCWTLVWFIYQKGNPFFIHRRVGKDEEVLNVIKFRTSSDYPGHDGTLKSDNYTRKRLECFLRSTSIDHLPQLFYVLTGKMSLVGPRPLLTDYLTLYSREQYRRHEVKPGITGWAQINGGNTISWNERFKLDVWYVDNISFLLDMKILFLTVYKVLKGEGINQPGYFSSEKFTGNETEKPLMIDLRPFKEVYRKEA